MAESENKLEYRQEVAFVSREKEWKYLKGFINKRPSEILFIHGPKSSGKTTLLYKFFEEVGKEQNLDVKFLNLRRVLISDYKDFIRDFFNFKIMENEFITLNKKGIKPVLVIDELQARDDIYMNGGKERQLIIELFIFFVAMTKESHLAHIIVASSDGYFINTVYNDSRLKKTSVFYKVDYLEKQDVKEWLLNLEKYSKIKDFTLTEGDVEKIWDVLGGSMWEIQDLLSQLFENSLDESLSLYKKKIQGFIAYYTGFNNEKKEIFKLMGKKGKVTYRELEKLGIDGSTLESVLQDMVRNNILYFDPTEATYYPQGPSYHWGIKLFCNTLK